ncbi:inositol-3-phosphate synthase [Actinoplanes ianthinogenes]|uniref:Inositol-3-phosphate synthase n=1 Tax=Actinoplanes ianthinogenes TaxID=122358 RepID=A0ABM7LL97_9ACTN|nr:inositol-3-phosphate synthase [Actinoplanes ianthinogenes]BCJ39943.1 inositol-3-phosphate synthase [Actinoplanes ianthinogenes]GGR09189.1 inositol-3-phosphate synthase [Actinoplanes ianthinogenes]
MIDKVRLAVVGVGNNTSALVQGISFYRRTGSRVGIGRPEVDGIGVGDVDVVAAFALSGDKVGRDLHEAIFAAPNNFPRIEDALAPSGVVVERGLVDDGGIERVAGLVKGAEVLLYSAPSGRPEIARAYAEVALTAGAAFVNTTSDPVARDPELLRRFEAAGLPLIGDDLASQFGTSVLHHTLLRLLAERGITLTSSYQVNLGGTEDFRNLVANPNTKHQSKVNALGSAQVQIAPLGYLPHLGSQKIAHLNLEAQGWAGTAVSLDVRLVVHDPSGAAGVNIDLVRMAAGAARAGRGGYLAEAAGMLKSPPGTAI